MQSGFNINGVFLIYTYSCDDICIQFERSSTNKVNITLIKKKKLDLNPHVVELGKKNTEVNNFTCTSCI